MGVTEASVDTGPKRSANRSALKGVVALLAAALLLLGGYGTYALWSDSAVLNGGSVNSGRLELSDATAGTWRDVSDGTPGTAIAAIADFAVVPGDVLTYTTTATIVAEGDNLEATLAADPSSVTGDTALLADMDVTTAVTIDGATVPTITEDNDGDTVTVVVTLAFDEASLNATQNQTINLSALTLTLSQNAR